MPLYVIVGHSPSPRQSVPSIDSSNDSRRVCCCLQHGLDRFYQAMHVKRGRSLHTCRTCCNHLVAGEHCHYLLRAYIIPAYSGGFTTPSGTYSNFCPWKIPAVITHYSLLAICLANCYNGKQFLNSKCIKKRLSTGWAHAQGELKALSRILYSSI